MPESMKQMRHYSPPCREKHHYRRCNHTCTHTIQPPPRPSVSSILYGSWVYEILD